MSDIFLSTDPEDEGEVSTFARPLELFDYRSVCASVRPDWVWDTAEKFLDRGTLIPVAIDDVPPPLGFGRIEAVDVIDWPAGQEEPPFQTLSNKLTPIIGRRREVSQSSAYSLTNVFWRRITCGWRRDFEPAAT